jgi:hypothetical protein
MLKEPNRYERYTSEEKFTASSRQVSPASLLVVSAVNCQTALMDKSGMVRTQMGTYNTSEMVAVHGTVIPRRNSNSNLWRVNVMNVRVMLFCPCSF